MGELTDKIKGAVNDAIGRGKQAAGAASDRPDIAAEGDAQRTVGGLQKGLGSVKGALGDKI